MSDSINNDCPTKIPLSKLIVCSECDLLMTTTQLAQDQRIDCPRCGAELQVYRHDMIRRALALTLTALVLFIPANFLSILFLNLLGQKREASVWDSVKGLYESGMHAISFIVLLCGFAIPLCKLFCQLYVLLALYLKKGLSRAILFFKTYQQMKEWGMLEIYLFGILVSIVKLHGMAELHLGMGLACFMMLIFVQVWLELVMNPSQIWSLLGKKSHGN